MSSHTSVYSHYDEPSIPRLLRAPAVLLQRGGAAWLTVAASLLLVLMGALAIDAAESLRPSSQHLFNPTAMRHLMFSLLGIGCACAVALPNYRRLGPFSFIAYGAVLLLLIFLLVPFIPTSIVRPRGGARGWIDLGPVDFQPSELMKVAYIVALAWYLRYKKNHRTVKGLLWPAIITGVPMGLIILQPDLGSAILFIPALFFVLIAAGAKLKHLVLAVVIAALGAPAVYPLLKPHQKQRIVGLFLQVKGDDRENLDINMQPVTAQRLIGSGGFLGRSEEETRALQHFNALPERHNDMVFAPVVTRFGFVGGMAALGLCLAWCAGAILTAGSCGSPFGRLICVGAAGFFFAQTVVNVGMNIGLLPIIGITLPFVSHGGSSMIAQWLMTGLVLSAALHKGGYEIGQRLAFDDEDLE
ncbi:MAG: FtsW/RodA/SpoVE family cell cycle protein [Phycisphaerales bacterium]